MDRAGCWEAVVEVALDAVHQGNLDCGLGDSRGELCDVILQGID